MTRQEKTFLNEQINEIACFVLNMPDVEVLADLIPSNNWSAAFRTDITKLVRFNTHDAVLHIELHSG